MGVGQVEQGKHRGLKVLQCGSVTTLLFWQVNSRPADTTSPLHQELLTPFSITFDILCNKLHKLGILVDMDQWTNFIIYFTGTNIGT